MGNSGGAADGGVGILLGESPGIAARWDFILDWRFDKNEFDLTDTERTPWKRRWRSRRPKQHNNWSERRS